MGIISGLDVNPDEWNGHVKAAAYYIQNWLPPAVDDPRIVSSISVFGVSYLWQIDPYYFIAVKATQVLSGIVSDFYLRVRLANAFCFSHWFWSLPHRSNGRNGWFLSWSSHRRCGMYFPTSTVMRFPCLSQ